MGLQTKIGYENWILYNAENIQITSTWQQRKNFIKYLNKMPIKVSLNFYCRITVKVVWGRIMVVYHAASDTGSAVISCG